MHATTDHLPPYAGGPGTSSFARARDDRVLEHAREQAADALAGRTIWCFSALPSGLAAAEAVQACLLDPEQERVATAAHGVEGDAALRQLAHRLDAMLAGAVAAPAAFGARERTVYAGAVADGERLLGEEVRSGDVVVLHDALAAALTEAARARGAHVVRHLDRPERHGAGPAAAAGFLDGFCHGIDAWVATAPAGVTAAMPSPDHVDRKQAGDTGLCWRAALAAVVAEDREEHVGGTVAARPRIAPR